MTLVHDGTLPASMRSNMEDPKNNIWRCHVALYLTEEGVNELLTMETVVDV